MAREGKSEFKFNLQLSPRDPNVIEDVRKFIGLLLSNHYELTTVTIPSHVVLLEPNDTLDVSGLTPFGTTKVKFREEQIFCSFLPGEHLKADPRALLSTNKSFPLLKE